MGMHGIIHEDERVELIDGEIIQMSPIGDKHARCVNRFNRHLVLALGERAIVSIQNPVVLSAHDEPQPDAAVLAPGAEQHDGTPRSGDVLLLVEVSDTTLRYDQRVKLPLYARAGIPEVWIADLGGEAIIQYADPEEGTFRAVTTYRRGQSITPRILSNLTFRVVDLLP
jgi:Uma2 family endonuclease